MLLFKRRRNKVDKKNIYIIGSKGIPANYGGFETFVENLTEKKKNLCIKYHVACMAKNKDVFEYNNARCFNIKVPNIGAAKAVFYDIKALKATIKHIKENNVNNAIVYILACRIGPFIGHYKKELKKLGCKLYINPDGHEWKRAKWNALIKKYWKLSEKLMVKNADLLICDSINIEKYIKEDYKKYNPKTTFIAYGADIEKSKLDDSDKKLMDWYKDKKITIKEYYLAVGRFVPEILRIIQALQMSDCTHSPTPANWMPGQPVLQPPPRTFPLLQERLEQINEHNSGMNWYLAFQEPKQECLEQKTED